MILFFSFCFIFTIAIINFWVSEGENWFLIVFAIICLFFHWNNIKRRISKKKFFLGITILLGILFHIGINSYRPVAEWKINSNIPTSVKIETKFKNHYIAKTKQGTKIFLADVFYIKGKQKKLNLFSGDHLYACFNVSQQINKKTNFDYFLMSEGIKTQAYLNNQCKIKNKPGQQPYNHILRYFNNFQNVKVKKWIHFFLFQIDSAEIAPNRKTMNEMGISHLFIISGFHLLIIGKFWFWIATKSKNQKLKIILKAIGWLFCLGLAYLTNWKLSAVKALIWLFLLLVPQKWTEHWEISQKEKISLLGLGFLLWNPLIFYQLSFQFSFLASWTLAGIRKSQTKTNWQKIKNMFLKNWGVWIMILPILINLNSQISLITPFLVVLYSILVVIFYFVFFWIVWIRELESFWKIVFEGFEMNLRFWKNHNVLIPFGIWAQHWILFYYVVLLLLWKAYWLNLSTFYIWMVWLLLTGAIFTAVWFAQPYYHLHMINVGHGLAMFLQNPSRTTNILFDAGSGKQKENNTAIISKYLKKLNVWKLDAIFVSHEDADHYNNLKHLKENFYIKKIIINNKQASRYVVNEIIFENLAFDYYEQMLDENNKSLILQFKIYQQNFLFTFDAEKEAESALIREGKLNYADILQVAHHGSVTSSTENFLKFIEPKYCLISNRKKTEIVQQRLKRQKCSVYTTKKDGHIAIQIWEEGIKIIAEKN